MHFEKEIVQKGISADNAYPPRLLFRRYILEGDKRLSTCIAARDGEWEVSESSERLWHVHECDLRLPGDATNVSLGCVVDLPRLKYALLIVALIVLLYL